MILDKTKLSDTVITFLDIIFAMSIKIFSSRRMSSNNIEFGYWDHELVYVRKLEDAVPFFILCIPTHQITMKSVKYTMSKTSIYYCKLKAGCLKLIQPELENIIENIQANQLTTASPNIHRAIIIKCCPNIPTYCPQEYIVFPMHEAAQGPRGRGGSLLISVQTSSFKFNISIPRTG